MSIAIPASVRPLGLWANGMVMTPDEFDAVTDWDENYCYELVHEVLIVSPAPAIGERRPNDELGYLLRGYWYHDPRGKVIDDTVSEQSIITSAGRRRADRVVWTGLGRAPDPGHDVPTIVIEFTSDSTRDRKRDYETKHDEYLAAGVREYWVIDRFQRLMTVFEMSRKLTIAEDEIYRSALLPGFELSPARLFAVAELGTGEG